MTWPNWLFLLGVVALAIASPSAAQSQHAIELFVGPGFRFGGNLDTEEGEVDVTNTPAFTTTLGVRARHDAFFEFTYGYQPAELEVEDFTGGSSLSTFDLGVHYIQFGGIVQKNYEPGSPFFGLTVGVVVFDPEPEGFTTETKFAGSIFGGGKTLLTPRIGLRGEARLWATYFPEDVALFCSLPGFCAINVSGDAMFQGETTGGLFITF